MATAQNERICSLYASSATSIQPAIHIFCIARGWNINCIGGKKHYIWLHIFIYLFIFSESLGLMNKKVICKTLNIPRCPQTQDIERREGGKKRGHRHRHRHMFGDWLMFVLLCLRWSRRDGEFAGSDSAAQPYTAWRAFGQAGRSGKKASHWQSQPSLHTDHCQW